MQIGIEQNCSNIFIYCHFAFFKPLTLINTNKKYILVQIRANIYTVLFFEWYEKIMTFIEDNRRL